MLQFAEPAGHTDTLKKKGGCYFCPVVGPRQDVKMVVAVTVRVVTTAVNVEVLVPDAELASSPDALANDEGSTGTAVTAAGPVDRHEWPVSEGIPPDTPAVGSPDV